MAVISGVVLPTFMLIVKRHYSARKNDWEQTLLCGTLGAVGIGGGVWLFHFVQGDETQSWGVGVLLLLFLALALAAIFIGLILLGSAILDGKRLVSETRAEGD